MPPARDVAETVRALGWRGIAPSALIAITVAQAVLDHGAFSTTARIVFAVLAALAAAAALLAGGRPALRAARHPFVVVLIVLATLGAASSLWTVGVSEDALTWALLPAGYALLAAAVLAAGVRAAPVRTVVIASICGCAFVSGVVGLIGVATFSEPQAFRPTGAWRPAGTLEYTPALALLEVCALAALLRLLCAGGRVAWLAAVPAAVAGAVLGLSHSRLGVVMALAVVAATVLAPRVSVRAPRPAAVAAAALVVLAGVSARAVLGGAVPVGAEAQAWRVAVVIGLCACAPLVWAALGRAARGSWPLVALCCVAALTVAGSVGGFAGSLGPAGTAGPQAAAHKHRARPISNDLLHGRRAIWSASLRAIRERPLQGHGAGGFLTATAHLQDAAITSYAHDLPLEAGVELGLAGGLLVLALYLIVARALWRGRAVAGAWVVAVPALAFLVANLVDWPWHVAGMGAIWSTAAAALIAAGRAGPPPGRIPSPAPPGRMGLHRKA